MGIPKSSKSYKPSGNYVIRKMEKSDFPSCIELWTKVSGFARPSALESAHETSIQLPNEKRLCPYVALDGSLLHHVT